MPRRTQKQEEVEVELPRPLPETAALADTWGETRAYVTGNNPDGEFYPGVPLHDLTLAEALELIPEWLQDTIVAKDWWSAS